jgi:signal peptidase I
VTPRKKSRTNSIVELVVIVAVALGLALLIQAFVVKPYKIPSGSMEPTLQVGQRVLVDRVGMDFENPKVGDIVVFHPPEDAEEEECGGVAAPPHRVTYGGAACDKADPKEASVNFIKRIVAGPGDWLYVKGGDAYLSTKGEHGPYEREHAPYTRACGSSLECSFKTPIHIPSGHWFMMGDNRGESDDSRFWGPVPTKWIVGVAFATYWPLDRIGFF